MKFKHSPGSWSSTIRKPVFYLCIIAEETVCGIQKWTDPTGRGKLCQVRRQLWGMCLSQRSLLRLERHPLYRWDTVRPPGFVYLETSKLNQNPNINSLHHIQKWHTTTYLKVLCFVKGAPWSFLLNEQKLQYVYIYCLPPKCICVYAWGLTNKPKPIFFRTLNCALFTSMFAAFVGALLHFLPRRNVYWLSCMLSCSWWKQNWNPLAETLLVRTASGQKLHRIPLIPTQV